MIGIEGIDAVGKQTQSSLLERWLRDRGLKTTSLSFPDYDTSIGKEIRAFLSGQRDFLPELQHMLFAANRWEKAPLIRQYKETNTITIVNRYSESNFAYGLADGLDIEWLMALEQGLPKTDLVIVLDASPSGLMSRRPGQGDSYETNSKLQSSAQEAYKKLAPLFGWRVVDASKDIETVHASVVEIVKKSMSLGRRGRQRP